MTNVSAIGNSSYNAVKIKINDPKTTIPEDFKAGENGNYNAINIEVNRPTVDVVKTSDIAAEYAVAAFMPVEVPAIPVNPVAYEAYANADTVDEQEAEEAYDAVFNEEYWLASSCVEANSGIADFGLRYVSGSDVNYGRLWSFSGDPDYGNCGVRAVVSLRSDVMVTKV